MLSIIFSSKACGFVKAPRLFDTLTMVWSLLTVPTRSSSVPSGTSFISNMLREASIVAFTEGACVSEVSTMEKPPMPRIFERFPKVMAGPTPVFFRESGSWPSARNLIFVVEMSMMSPS